MTPNKLSTPPRGTRAGERLLAIIQIQQEVASLAHDPIAMKRHVAEAVQALVNADFAAVGRVTPTEILYPTLVGERGEGPLRVSRSTSLAGWCVEHRTAALSHDLPTDPRAPGARRGGLPIRAALFVPLVHGDEVIGVLAAMSRHPATFDDDDLRTLSLLAGILATALANARVAAARAEAQRVLEFQAKVLESVDQAVVAVDLEGAITYWNACAERQFGWKASEVVGRLGRTFLVPADSMRQAREVIRHVLDGEPWSGPYEFLRRDGSRFIAHATTSPLYDSEGRVAGLIIVSRDVTKERELETQLRHAQKMQAVGQLAGGVAHDFNNILTAITSYAELLHDEVKEAALRADIEEIRRAAARGADLTRQMLAFSRKQVLQPVRFDAADVVRELEGMLRRLLTAEIDFHVSAPVSGLPLFADRTQLEQVLLNLVVNARDAIRGGGRITMTAEATPQGLLAIAVEDTGAGIPVDVLPRVFEPFFTTKPAGKGTGLGLSVVHGIVQQMRGTIDVESQPGRGTKFTITLPLAAPEEAVAPPRVSTPVHRRSGETVLLVEDNSALLTLCHRVLEKEGYEVVCADTPEAALQLAHGRVFDALITDVVMPDMNGTTLVDRLEQAGVIAPVVFMSGYTEDAAIMNGRTRDQSAFLAKPFTPGELTSGVRKLIDESRG